jgi:hypothetical protein
LPGVHAVHRQLDGLIAGGHVRMKVGKIWRLRRDVLSPADEKRLTR